MFQKKFSGFCLSLAISLFSLSTMNLCSGMEKENSDRITYSKDKFLALEKSSLQTREILTEVALRQLFCGK